MRTLVDIPDDDVRWLDLRATAQGKSRAALVRDAVTAYRAEAVKSGIAGAFGIWKDRTDIGDAVDWQRRERAGWTRPWDHDYDEVRAEFPDLFSPDEDRERRYWKDVEERRRHERGE
ncbi:ribbon-helix-helix protein, CopG family [uncultured Sphingomonas sp.]|uniref:ribbon-helix-helix protein, CopG family n=1 Tax=uncultured Sphingomonas sp. TaxID=158754 RepID=UPI0035CC36D8